LASGLSRGEVRLRGVKRGGWRWYSFELCFFSGARGLGIFGALWGEACGRGTRMDGMDHRRESHQPQMDGMDADEEGWGFLIANGWAWTRMARLVEEGLGWMGWGKALEAEGVWPAGRAGGKW
jgi:hypothetical protein